MLVGVHKPDAKVVLLQQVQVVAEKVEQVLTLGISLQDRNSFTKGQEEGGGAEEPVSEGLFQQLRNHSLNFVTK